MKRYLGIIVAVACMALWGSRPAAAATVTDRLVDLLVKKGIVSPMEANELRSELNNEQARSGEDLPGRVETLEKQVMKEGTLRAYWKEGLGLETADKQVKLKVGGRVYSDWSWQSGDRALTTSVGRLTDGTEFRAARLFISGEFYDNAEFKAEYDFAGSVANFKDVYIGLNDLPFGGVRVGHYKEPFSIEELTSSRFITFMERSLPNTFVPGRNTGLMVHDTAFGDRATWAAGVFRDVGDFGNGSSDGDYSATVRLTGVPWYEEDGERLLHLGVAYSFRDANDESARFRSRPEVHLGPRYVDTLAFAADAVQLVGGEAAAVLGSFSLQGEYVTALVDPVSGRFPWISADDPTFSGYYLYGSWFLTGEHRHYKVSSAAFDRVRPKRNFLGKDRGAGAWELAIRYSSLDLDFAGNGHEELDDVTVGLNWYLNPNTRVMWNYVRADKDQTGEADLFQTRFQVDF